MNNKVNLYKKIHTIQTKISGLAKDKQGNNYQFLSGDKLLNVVRPLMDELGLLLKPEIKEIVNVRQDYSTKNGEKSEMFTSLKINFTWIDVDTGECEVCEFAGNGLNGWDKGLGSALTYAERYFLIKFFHIPTDEDDVDQEAAILGLSPKEKEVINKISECKTQEELNTFFRANKNAFSNQKIFIDACAERKKQIA